MRTVAFVSFVISVVCGHIVKGHLGGGGGCSEETASCSGHVV